jgi:hypothetical protein
VFTTLLCSAHESNLKINAASAGSLASSLAAQIRQSELLQQLPPLLASAAQ